MINIIAVILAAGTSSRLGFNKLTVTIDGESVIRKSVRPFILEDIHRVMVVTGNNRQDIEKELEGLGVFFIHNPHFQEGMSSSVKASIPFIKDADAAIFHLGDKPLITSHDVLAAIETYKTCNARIVAPFFQGKMGHPVMIDTALLCNHSGMLHGDSGLREVIEKYREDVVFIEGSVGNLFDIDTAQAITQLRERGFRVEESKR